jgi:hypothetical protein
MEESDSNQFFILIFPTGSLALLTSTNRMTPQFSAIASLTNNHTQTVARLFDRPARHRK